MRILIIPDTQVKPGVNLDHLTHAGQYIVDKRPDVIVHLGDHFDMESLSSYDKGKLSAEGRRYKEDLEAGHRGMNALLLPLVELQLQQAKNRKKVYTPRMVFCTGNHENRADRVTSNNPEFNGFIGSELLGLEHYGWEVHPFLQPVEIEGIFFCLTPDHRVLKDTLDWVELGDIKIGDKIVAFDEEVQPGESSRKYRFSEVLKHDIVPASVFKVTLSNGDIFKTTKDHRWLGREFISTGYKWITTEQLKERLDKGGNSYRVMKLFDTWETETSFNAGWLSGMFDGEGCLSKPNASQGGVLLTISQNQGSTLDKIVDVLNEFGVEHNQYEDNIETHKTVAVRVLGCSNKKVEFMGRFKPQRLIKKFNPRMLGSVQKPDNMEDVYVTSVEYLGVEDVVMIETSTGTMIADGYAHHNCHYLANPMSGKPYAGTAMNQLKTVGRSFVVGHKQVLDVAIRPTIDGKHQIGIVAGAFYSHHEDYKGPTGNNHWRGIIMLNEVQDGYGDPMFVSLNYLKRRYGA